MSIFHRALEIAVEVAYLPCLDALLSSGKTDPNTRLSNGDLALHVACASGSIPIIRRLYSVTTTIGMKNNIGNTPLHLASKCGRYEAVEFLIQRGADINAQNQFSMTPLLLAIENGHEAVQMLLLENGAELDAVDTSLDQQLNGGGVQFQSGDVLNDFDFESFL